LIINGKKYSKIFCDIPKNPYLCVLKLYKMKNNIIKTDLFVYDSPHFNKEDYHKFLNKLEKKRKSKPIIFQENELHKIEDYLTNQNK
jgi:hypothetical protein